MSWKLFTLDYVLLALYLAGTLYVGLRVGRRIKGGRDFFLAGRTLPWWAIGFSLVATDIGGTDMIGVGGTAFAHGISVANFEWIGCVPAMPAVIKSLGWEPLFRIRDPYLYFSVWAFLTALCLIVVVSLLTRPEPEGKIDGLVF